MDRLKMPEGEPIEAGMVTRSIEGAQRKVEARNFDIRKQLLEYDDVANDQRKVIYTQRNELLEAADISELIASLRTGVFTDVVRTYVPAESVEEQWDVPTLERVLADEWSLSVPLAKLLEEEPNLNDDDILERVLAAAEASYEAKVGIVGKEAFGGFERNVMLQNIDTHWREHLAALDHLRQGIHLRGYAQKNPKQEYKREAFELFGAMLDQIKNEVIRTIMTVRIQTREEVEAAEAAMQAAAAHLENVNYQHADFDPTAAPEELMAPLAVTPGTTAMADDPATTYMGVKVGRNDPCPCGSGKKFKACHGKLA
jgi:preprotein translocase subunit SecA